MKQKKKVYPTEHEDQVLLFEWAELQSGKYPQLHLLNASSNGVRVPIGAAMKLKRQGLKKGYPDLFLPFPHKGYHGLFIELKRANRGVISEEQKWWLKNLNSLEYKAEVCYGFEEAKQVILDYLKEPTRKPFMYGQEEL